MRGEGEVEVEVVEGLASLSRHKSIHCKLRCSDVEYLIASTDEGTGGGEEDQGKTEGKKEAQSK